MHKGRDTLLVAAVSACIELSRVRGGSCTERWRCKSSDRCAPPFVAGRTVIEQSEIVALLLQACPSFRKELEKSDNADLLYPLMWKFAHYLLSLHRGGNVGEFQQIADLIERLHLEGDQKVREFATVGILEAIQNVWSNNGEDPGAFIRWLKPESRKWWNELNEFWAGRTSYVGAGLHNKRSERRKGREE